MEQITTGFAVSFGMLRSPTVCQPHFPIAIRGGARLVAIGFVLAITSIVAFALDRDRHITQFYYSFWSAKDGAPSEAGRLED